MRRLVAIVESSDDAIISKDLNGVITSWNKGSERLYGYTEKEALGRHVSIVIPKECEEELRGILENIRKGQAVEHFEALRQKKDGTKLDVSLTISPIKDSNGNITGASTIARDITERKKMDRLLQGYNENLEREVEDRTRELKERLEELERFRKATIEREFRIKELRDEIERLKSGKSEK